MFPILPEPAQTSDQADHHTEKLQYLQHADCGYQVTTMATLSCGGSGPLWSASTMSSASACCSLSPGRPAFPTKALQRCEAPTAFGASALRSGAAWHRYPGLRFCVANGVVYGGATATGGGPVFILSACQGFIMTWGRCEPAASRVPTRALSRVPVEPSVEPQ